MELELDRLATTLYSAVVSDACDHIGLRNQTLHPGTRPLAAASTTLVGWARPVVTVPVTAPPERPYGTEIDFIDSLRTGDVVVAHCSHADTAFWGELFSTAATGRGARGAVVDGYIRDLRGIDELGFPLHALGTRPADSLGRLSIEQSDIPLTVRGVEVSPGDFVIADLDGVTVVPRAVAAEVLQRALDKATTESDARRLLLDGGKLADVWERYRVL